MLQKFNVLIRQPAFVVSNTMYETIMGSVCYGVSDDLSDFDTLGFCIPPRDMIFPHLAGEIDGFGRRLFLHKGAWHKFKGYAYSQLHAMDSKNPEPDSKRAKIRDRCGYDVKFAYHVVRLIGEVEQILVEGDIDLRRNREQLKAIRRGEVPQEDIRRIFTEKERDLEKLYHSSTLPYSPDEGAIKQLLLECLEEHYGDLSTAVVNPDAMSTAFREIASIVHKYERLAA